MRQHASKPRINGQPPIRQIFCGHAFRYHTSLLSLPFICTQCISEIQLRHVRPAQGSLEHANALHGIHRVGSCFASFWCFVTLIKFGLDIPHILRDRGLLVLSQIAHDLRERCLQQSGGARHPKMRYVLQLQPKFP